MLEGRISTSAPTSLPFNKRRDIILRAHLHLRVSQTSIWTQIKAISWLARVTKHPWNPGYGGSPTTVQKTISQRVKDGSMTTHRPWNWETCRGWRNLNPKQGRRGLEVQWTDTCSDSTPPMSVVWGPLPDASQYDSKHGVKIKPTFGYSKSQQRQCWKQNKYPATLRNIGQVNFTNVQKDRMRPDTQSSSNPPSFELRNRWTKEDR